MNMPTTIPDPARQLLPVLGEEGGDKAKAPVLLKRLLATVGGLLIVLLVLAAVIPMGGAVIGGGSVGVESRVKRIAHPTGGRQGKGTDDEEGLFPGECTATSRSEHGKVSLPALASIRPNDAQQAALLLLGLLQDPKLERFFSKDSERGSHAAA